MQRWGRTSAGSIRYFCRFCSLSSTRKRTDNRQRNLRRSFLRWITGTTPLAVLARQSHLTIQGLLKRFESFWHHAPAPRSWHPASEIIVLDATSLAPRIMVALIVRGMDVEHQDTGIAWSFEPRESYRAWHDLLLTIPAPSFAVCDGQKGLLLAIRELWPHAKMQRCLIHVIRQSMAWLTQHPRTGAGRDLLQLVRALSSIRTRRQKRRWIRSFRRWVRRYEDFLKERTLHSNNKHWWYTHRKVRAVRSLLANSISDLFTFVRYPWVPRTSNHVEGGINSRLQELIRSHRGFSLEKKAALAAYFLAARQDKQQRGKTNTRV